MALIDGRRSLLLLLLLLPCVDGAQSSPGMPAWTAEEGVLTSAATVVVEGCSLSVALRVKTGGKFPWFEGGQG